MQLGSPEQSVSQALSHVEAAPASGTPREMQRPSACCSHTTSALCPSRSWAACAQLPGTPTGQSALSQRHSRSSGDGPPTRNPQFGKDPGSTTTPGHAPICSQRVICDDGSSKQFAPATPASPPPADVAPPAWPPAPWPVPVPVVTSDRKSVV